MPRAFSNLKTNEAAKLLMEQLPTTFSKTEGSSEAFDGTVTYHFQ
jgi:hypothetical protein